MNGLSALKNRGRMLAGAMMIAAFTTAAAAGAPAAVASPSSPAAPSHLAAAKDKPVKVSWSEAPSSATKVDGRVRYSYTNIAPGSTIKDYVAIINSGKANAAFSVYGTDATGTSATDALTFLQVGKKPTDIGSWVHFVPSKAAELSLLIPHGHGVIEPFTISVPANATPGDHTGGMVAQVGVPATSKKGQRIVEYQRIVVPVELRVTGALRASLQVQSISTGFSNPLNPFGNGAATISYSVFNNGNVRLTGTQQVQVTGLFGMSSKVKPESLPVVLPGDSVRITQTLHGLYPAGELTAHITVKPAWPKTSPPLAVPVLTQTSGSAGLFAFPWAVFVLILLLGGAGYGTARLLRWRSREHLADMAAVAERARRETERRLLGSRKSTATVGAPPAEPAVGGGGATPPDAGDAGPDSGSKAE